MTTFHAACIQLHSIDDMDHNIEIMNKAIKEAAAQGASLIILPENAGFMARHKQQLLSIPTKEEGHPVLAACQELAASLRITLIIGSLAIHDPAFSNLRNRCYVIGEDGNINARYDKIHLFDVTLPGQPPYEESAHFSSGNQALLVDTAIGKIGLTICYDLRFPHLFRMLAKAGAVAITVPAAFTYTTGQAHWHSLLRARAIENGCYILAPAQCGLHSPTRKTYGHSMIIDPWGSIIAEASEDKPEIIYAELALEKINACRAMIPSLMHDRDFHIPETI